MGIDASPDGPPIASIRSKRLTWGEAMAELTDNALDAAAKRVEILLGSNRFSVQDDGVGMENLLPVVKYGEHRASPSTRVGRYGIGMKDVIFRGDEVRIATVHRGRRRTIAVRPLSDNFRNLELPDPQETSEPSGTLIDVLRIPKSFPAFRPQDVSRYLSRMFAPAIVSGRQILVGRHGRESEPVAAWQPPQLLMPVIEHRHELGDGRALSVRAGIMADPKADGRGTFVAYAYRYLDESRIGLEDSPGARIHISVTLHETRSKAWHLEEHKRGLLENHRDDLSEAIRPLVKPLIERDERERRNLRIDRANAILAAAFGDGGGSSTPRPGQGEVGGEWSKKEPEAEPPDPAGPKVPAPRKRKSKKTRRPKPRGIKVSDEALGIEGPPYRYDEAVGVEGKTIEVTFNSDHALWKQVGDDDKQIAVAAVLVYGHSHANGRNQASFFEPSPGYLGQRSEECGAILARILGG